METITFEVEKGEPNAETLMEPLPGDSPIAEVNNKLDAILAALGITYGKENSDDNQ